MTIKTNVDLLTKCQQLRMIAAEIIGISTSETMTNTLQWTPQQNQQQSPFNPNV